MSDIQTISATKARNNFFQILNDVYFNKNTYIVTKNNIPLAQITPINPSNLNQIAQNTK